MLQFLTLIVLIYCSSVFAEDKLLLLQTVWRHGDRAPMSSYKTNTYKDTDWDEPYGELLKEGVKRHNELGRLIHQKYVGEGKLLSSFNPSEVYVRSTDRNRTILSAVSNLLGTFYTDDHTASNWPASYVPVPIHTVDPKTDTLLDPLAPCPRSKWLWNSVMESEFFKNLTKKNEELINFFSNYTGETINLDNIWKFYDAVYVQIHIKGQNTFNKTKFLEIESIKKLIDDMEDGLYVPPSNDIDYAKEIPKVRGGYLVNTMTNFMKLKWDCRNDANDSCTWVNNRKYNAYSAHDNTVTAILAALGNKAAVIPNGYPNYAACIFLELWDHDGKPAVKLLFHQDDDVLEGYRTLNGTNGIEPFTNIIRNCETVGKDGFCNLDLFMKTAKESDPGDINELCNDIPKSTNTATTNTFLMALIISQLYFLIALLQ